MALDLDGAAREQARVDGIPPLDLDVAALRAQLAHARPERLLGIVLADPFEQREQVGAAHAPARREASVQGVSLREVELADDLALGLVLVRLHPRPAPLEQVAEVARFPAADLERPRATGVERAAERGPGRVGNLAAREVP